MVLAIVAGSRCGRHIHNPTNQLIAYVGCICQILVGFKVKNKKVPLARRRFKSKDPFKPMRNYHVGMRATWNEHLERHRSHSVHRSRPCRRFLDDLRTILHQALVGLSQRSYEASHGSPIHLVERTCGSFLNEPEKGTPAMNAYGKTMSKHDAPQPHAPTNGGEDQKQNHHCVPRLKRGQGLLSILIQKDKPFPTLGFA